MSARMCKASKSTSVYFFFLEVLILWGALAAITWLCISPKSPTYIITDVWGNFTLQNKTGFIRNNSLVFNIKISNPNRRIGVYFEFIHMTLNHSGSAVGNKFIPGFYQGFKQITPCKIALEVDQKFLQQVAGSTTTTLKVGLETAVQYEIFWWKIKHHLMNVAAHVPIDSDRYAISGKMTNIMLHHKCT